MFAQPTSPSSSRSASPTFSDHGSGNDLDDDKDIHAEKPEGKKQNLGLIAAFEDKFATSMANNLGAGIGKTLDGLSKQQQAFAEKMDSQAEEWKGRIGLGLGELDAQLLNDKTEEGKQKRRVYKQILAAPYKPNSKAQEYTRGFRSFFTDAPFITAKHSTGKQDAGTIRTVISGVFSVLAAFSKPRIFSNFPQKTDVRALQSDYDSNLPSLDTVKNITDLTQILPSEDPKPVDTLSEMLSILGKKSYDTSSKGSKQDDETALNWGESFLSKATSLDGVLGKNEGKEKKDAELPNFMSSSFADSSENSEPQSAGQSGVPSWLQKGVVVLTGFLSNIIENISRDDDYEGVKVQLKQFSDGNSSFLGQKAQAVVTGIDFKKAQEESLKDSDVEDGVVITDDGDVIIHQREDAAAKADSKKQKDPSEIPLKYKSPEAKNRDRALNSRGTFLHKGEDLADCQSVRYFFFTAQCVNALSLRIGASVAKDLYDTREKAKQNFLDEKFSKLEKFDLCRKNAQHLTRFNLEGFKNTWNDYRRQTLQNLVAQNHALHTTAEKKGEVVADAHGEGASIETASMQKDLSKQSENIVKIQRLSEMFGAAEYRIDENHAMMQSALESLSELMEDVFLETGVDLRAFFFIDGAQPSLRDILALGKINPEKLEAIRKQLAKANYYYEEMLKAASLGGGFDLKPYQLTYQESNISRMKKILKEGAKALSCETYPYQEEDRKRIQEKISLPDDGLQPHERDQKRDAMLTQLAGFLSGTGHADIDDVEAFEKEWVVPMIESSAVYHGTAKSLLWRSVVFLGGIALATGIVLLTALIAFTSFIRIVAVKLIGGLSDMVCNFGWGEEWRKEGHQDRFQAGMQDAAMGIEELVKFPYYILMTLASELYNEGKLYHDRVNQVVYPFLQK